MPDGLGPAPPSFIVRPKSPVQGRGVSPRRPRGRFHQKRVADGLSKSEASRAFQVELIRSGRCSSPRFWGAFALAGAGKAFISFLSVSCCTATADVSNIQQRRKANKERRELFNKKGKDHYDTKETIPRQSGSGDLMLVVPIDKRTATALSKKQVAVSIFDVNEAVGKLPKCLAFYAKFRFDPGFVINPIAERM
jgi:hypothetical protein